MHMFNTIALLAIVACASATQIFRAGGATVAVNSIRTQDFNIVDDKIAADSKKGLSTAPTRASLLGGGDKKAYVADSASLVAAGFTVVQDKATHITVGVPAGSVNVGKTTEELRTILNSHFTKLPDIVPPPKTKAAPKPVSPKKPAAPAAKPRPASPVAARPKSPVVKSPKKKLFKKRIPFQVDVEARDEDIEAREVFEDLD